jgi:hypothetical protein
MRRRQARTLDHKLLRSKTLSAGDDGAAITEEDDQMMKVGTRTILGQTEEGKP